MTFAPPVPAVIPVQGTQPLDLSPASTFWEDPPSGVHAPRITHAGKPDLARAARRRSGPDQPATVATGSLVLHDEPLIVVAPFDGTVVIQDGLIALLHDGCATVWHAIDPAVADGDIIKAGDSLGIAPAGFAVQLVETLPAPALYVAPEQAGSYLDPAVLLFGHEPPAGRLQVEDVVAIRAERMAPSQKAYYASPPNLVRAQGVWFTDENGLQYLDAVNNVTHLGHCHPRVVDAISRQVRRLNTNSRLVYTELAAYAERLTSMLPDPLDTVFFVCTGSEANDLAMRIARTVTNREDMLVVDGAYHGNTIAVTGISPNRYKAAGGKGAPSTTHEVVQPNRYRGEFGYDHPDAGAAYAAQGVAAVEALVANGTPPAAFIAESLMGTGGQVIFPPGFLAPIFAAVRTAGGLCISDEVQVGLGRLGTNFWGFQDHGVVPDIVTMGKPMGNGHPMAAVVTTKAIAAEFDNGMRYFNTFAGNPVSCAAGMAVLDALEEDNLQAHAADVGTYWLERLTALKDKHAIIGDVRGHGLYLGIELVTDRATKEPAKADAYAISERLKEEGVIMWPNGTLDNILKLKPPMVFGREHADLFTETLDEILSAGW